MIGVRFRRIQAVLLVFGILLVTGLSGTSLRAAETELAREELVQEETVQEELTQAETAQGEPVQEELTQAETAQGEPVQEETAQEGFTQEELVQNSEFGVLKVGYVSDRNPVSFKNENGEFDGVTKRIFDRIQALSGLKFEYVELPNGPVTYDYLLGEGFDLVTSVEYNEENKRARGILISHPYLTSRKVVVGRQDLSFDSNAHLKAAISTGSQTLRKVMASAYPNFELIDYDSIEDCFDAVNRGEADILIQNQFVAERFLYRPVYEKLVVVPVVGMDDELCFSAVTPLEEKEGAEWERCEAIIDVLDRAIAMLSEDEVTTCIIEGTMDNLYDFTFADFFYRYRFALIAVAAALAAVLLLMALSARLRVRTIKAQAEAKAKGNFLSTMSHEIRTPLHGMIGLNYLMEQNIGDREKLAEYLHQSSATAKYLQALINDILDMSKLEMNKMELVKGPFSLKDALLMIETIEKSRMEEKRLVFSIDMELPFPSVLGDASRVEQIVLNILDNAYKFTPAGGSVSMRVRQTPLKEGQVSTEIQIADTGCGISEEFRQKIFHSFTQERNAVSQGNQGTGLGMSISYLLAELMGGTLSVTSRLGEGSCFTFVFPAEIVQDDTDQKESGAENSDTKFSDVKLSGAKIPETKISGMEVSDAKESGTRAPGAEIPGAGASGGESSATGPETGLRAQKERLSVLIAEDNELNGQILKEILKEEKIPATLVTNGQEAVDRFAASAEGEYGVILMDLLMPVKDGYQATQEIRGLSRPDAKTVRIFACTANSFREDREKAMACGMDDFVAKPVDIRQLLQLLRS